MLIACTIKRRIEGNHETIRCRSYRTLVAGLQPQLCGQNTTPVRQNQRDTMIIPSEHNDSPFDFNHMAAGNDKSDELGVPYYQQHDL